MKSTLLSHKKLLVIAIAILVIIVGVLWYWYEHRALPLTLYGNVDIRQVSLSFNSSERINSLSVEEGDKVKKGQVLGTLRIDTLELTISRTKAQIAQQQAILDKALNGNRPQEIDQALASMNQAKANADNAQSTYNRMESLYVQHAISTQERDNAATAYKAALETYNNAQAAYDMAVSGSRTEDIASQRAALDVLQEQLKTYEYQLSQATLLAPQDGIIRSRLKEVGDMASPSSPVYMLALNEKKWVRAYITEPNLYKIHEGETAKVTIDGVKEALIGTVGFISSTAEFTPKNVETTELRTDLVYEVRIYVDDPDNVLRLGMPATVTF